MADIIRERKMLGLKTQESRKFERFWKLIQDTAQKRNCVFFGFAGEGRDFVTSEMEGENFSGWLVPMDEAAEFAQLWAKPSSNAAELDKAFPSAKFLFAIWNRKNDTISVRFQEY